MEHVWNWGIFLQKAPYNGPFYLNWVIDGMLTTVAVCFAAWVLAFLVGSLFGILRTLPNSLCRTLGAAYVAVFRNVPLLVQLFIWNLAGAKLLPMNLEIWFDVELDPNIRSFILAFICLGLFTGARVCEQVRSGIMSLSGGQRSAGLALGLTLPQTYRYVILPNAYRLILPPMTSEVMNLIKNSAVASVIGLMDLTSWVLKLQEETNQSYESFIVVTLVYALLNFLVIGIMRVVESKVRLPLGNMGGKNA